MKKFKVGDRVRIVYERGINWDPGMDKYLGTVMTVSDVLDNGRYLMEESRGSGPCGCGWLWNKENIVGLATKPSISIHTDGRTTTALLKEGKTVVKKAIAKCNPADTYDFATGASLAYSRLMEKPADTAEDTPVKAQPKLKLYCIKDYKPGEWFTKGKVYEQLTCGRHSWDDGYKSKFAPKDIMGGFPLDDGLTMDNFLVPLVSRPAKVGEWVYINNAVETNGAYQNGDVVRVTCVRRTYGICFDSGSGKTNHMLIGDGMCFARPNEYLVLKNYSPEPCHFCKQPAVGEALGMHFCKACAEKVKEVLNG